MKVYLGLVVVAALLLVAYTRLDRRALVTERDDLAAELRALQEVCLPTGAR